MAASHGHARQLHQRDGVTTLVYFEMHATMHAAITREKQIKRWNRAWKINLIERANPAWDDLWPEVGGDEI